MVAQRDAWAAELLEQCGNDDRVLVLDADLATSTKSVLVAKEHPEKFLQMGIAEQNMVAVAAGLASTGFVPWVSTFGVFLTQRSLDQIRMLVAQTGANVKLAGHYTGLLNGGSGKTHQDIEDLAILRAMPGLTVLVPADGAETRAAVRWAMEHDGPVYLRLARDDAGDLGVEPVITPDAFTVVSAGSGEVVVISTGAQSVRVARALRSVDGPERVTHLHAGVLRPLGEATVLDAVGSARLVVTVEEHTRLGGLGGLVSEAVAGAGLGVRVERIGLPDAWSESAPNAWLLDKAGLSAERLAERFGALLAGV